MFKKLLVLLPLFVPSLLLAGDFFDDDAGGTAGATTPGSKLSFELNGFTRGVFFGGNVEDKNEFGLKSGYGELGLKCRARIGRYGDGYAEFRLRGGNEFGSTVKEFNLREAYVNAYLGDLDIRLGHQIVVWGRADAFNPTNNITPQNMIARSTDEDDRKEGNFLLRATYRVGPLKLEGIWVPHYTPSVLPLFLFPLPDSVEYSGMMLPVELGTAYLPDASFRNSSIALKIGATLGPVDGSVSWFKGYMPTLGVFMGFDIIEEKVVVNTKAYQMNVFGADFSTNVGSFGLRGEFAFRKPIDDYTLYPKNAHVPNPDLQYVLGVDRTFGNLWVIAQYVGRYVADFQEFIPTGSSVDEREFKNRLIAGQQNRVSHAVLLRPSLPLFHEACTVELLGYCNFTTEEWLIRPSLSYNLADALILKAGWEGYFGPESMLGPDGTLFGNISDALSAVFVELKASF